MRAVVGNSGIFLALVSAAALVVAAAPAILPAPWLTGWWRGGRRVGAETVRLPALGMLAGALVALGAMEWALLANDFSLKYVAENSARSTPLLFKVATAWAALQGSILLWGLVLALFTMAVYRQVGKRLRVDGDDRLGIGALAVMGLVAVFFFGLLATVANPFHVLAVTPPDGPGPNPLLQNHLLMAIHPPLLYTGYVGFTAPFAFAISALALGSRGPAWVHRTQRWSLVAWVFLTAGITCGAWWSYDVLGWGGYWAWDPVENASLLPWLVGTAYIHSAVIQAKRGLLQAWSIALVLATFSLTILGTFLTRSGVIASVHSFTQSAIGPTLLVFLLVVVVGSFGLFAARAHLVTSTPPIDSLASREGAFIVNNLLLAVFAFTVLTGTLYPILVEAFTGDQLSVGRPFFDRMAVPLAFALLLMMGLGPLVPYRSARPGLVWERLRTPLQLGLGLGALAVVLGVRAPAVVLVLVVGGAIAGSCVRLLVVAVVAQHRAHPEVGWARTAGRIVLGDRSFWGGQVSHVGLVVVALGVAASATLADRSTTTLTPGQSARVGGYTVTYRDSFDTTAGNAQVHGIRFAVEHDGERRTMSPRLKQFVNQMQPVSTPSVWTHWRAGEDLYLSVAAINGDSVTVQIYRFPLVFLVWGGGLLTAAGGVLALSRRRRGGVARLVDVRDADARDPAELVHV